MRFLNSDRITQNMSLLVSHVWGSAIMPSQTLKGQFISAINTIQGTSFSGGDQINVEFDNRITSDFLYKNGVFNEHEVLNDTHIIDMQVRLSIENSIFEALSLIQIADSNLFKLLNQLVGSVGVYSIPERDGGSISNAIGLIWLSPLREWQKIYYGEMLVHEFVHNSVFLEDMVRGVLPNNDLLGVDDALSISAIRQTKRPYDKSFHSACVVIALMYYYYQIGYTVKANSYLPQLRTTIQSLKNSYERLASRNLYVLSPNGFEILKEMELFATNNDFSVIEKSLSN